jgi:hypothetical protein
MEQLVTESRPYHGRRRNGHQVKQLDGLALATYLPRTSGPGGEVCNEYMCQGLDTPLLRHLYKEVLGLILAKSKSGMTKPVVWRSYQRFCGMTIPEILRYDHTRDSAV